MLNNEHRHLRHPCGPGKPNDPELDSIVHKAASVCRTSMALISFVDEQRRWSSAGVGIAAANTPQVMSFCIHAIRGGETTVVEDCLRDLRLATNPLVKSEAGLRHYAGVPLRTDSGARLGTLCVLDAKPQGLTADQVRELERLAASTVEILEGRRAGASNPVRRAAAA